MSDWVAVADLDELKPKQMKPVKVDGQAILLCRSADGNYYAIDEYCSHEDYSLYYGCIQGNKIKCSLHGSYFDLQTGQALNEPADQPLATYAVRIDQNQVWVKLD